MKKETIAILFLLAACLAVRIALAAASRDIIDVQNYERAADTILESGLPALYTKTTGIYPYPPIWIWFELLAKLVASAKIVTFSLAIRLPSILSDTGICYLLWYWARNKSPEMAFLVGLIYALNPVSIIITSLHGQFDAIPILFSIIAIQALSQGKNQVASAISLSIGIAVKSFPILLLLPILLHLKTKQERLVYMSIAVLSVVALLLPFVILSPQAVTRELLGYRGSALLGFLVPIRTFYVSLTGQSVPLELTLQIISISSIVFILLYLGTMLWTSRFTLAISTSCSIVLLLFYVLYAGIAPQYLLWLLPFLLIIPSEIKRAVIYAITSTLGLVGFYLYAIPELFAIASFPILTVSLQLSRILYGVFGSVWWLSCLGLLLQSLRSARTTESVANRD